MQTSAMHMDPHLAHIKAIKWDQSQVTAESIRIQCHL